MFQTIKEKISLLSVLQEDLKIPFRQSGENFIIDDEAEYGGCPFCGHKDCFKVKDYEDPSESHKAFYHCFSCGEHGDVIEWRAKRKNISQKDACLDLAKEFNVPLPHDYSPIQEMFNLAARYYETCMWESCNKPYIELAKMTPSQYQQEVRKHSEDVLRKFHVGWSDGGLIEYLDGLGFDKEIIVQSGLCSVDKKTGAVKGDFLPSRCFIYPHYAKGRVSHFTFKDPLKKLAYQLPKKFSLNGYCFYNQDSIKAADTVIIVEGENDLLSVSDTGRAPAVIGTIGQISGEQLDWMRENLSSKNVLTLFDPDEAGWKYRVKVEKNRKYYRNLAHVLPPEEKDIDELLCSNGVLEDIIKGNVVKVDPNMFDKEESKSAEVVEVPWEQGTPEGFQSTLKESGLDVPGEPTSQESGEEDKEDGEHGNVVQRRGAYWRIKFVDGVPQYTQISDFTIKLLNVFIDEDGNRSREIVVVKDNGYRSAPFLINDDTKVSTKPFRVIMARAADASYVGTDHDLDSIWKIVYSKVTDKEINVPRVVGRHEKHRAWIFRNKLISDTGSVIDPDENGVFWMHGRSIGLRPESLADSQGEDDRTDIPEIVTNITVEEKDELLEGILSNVSKNLNSEGKALLLLAWVYASVYSNMIFEMHRGFPFLFFWGTNGKGKTTVAKWVTQDFFGINGHGSTSVPNLGSAAGWGRTAEYYSGFPLIIDEVRSDDLTRQYLGLFRSYYDREARVLGKKESFGVQTRKPRANFVFIGEDQFEDPATRERCIPIRIPVNNRELRESYIWMESNKHLFTGITYHWILDSCRVFNNPDLKEALKGEIRALDRKLLEAGCPQRTSKNWAAIGVFGLKLCEQFMPEFDFMQFLVGACMEEASYQKSDTTLMQFWDYVEGIMAKEFSPITDKHIMRDGNQIHIWYSAVFKIVQDELKGKFPFSKNAVKSAIKEEPYFLSEDRKITMGLDGTRRTVITLDLNKCPDSIRNIALAN